MTWRGPERRQIPVPIQVQFDEARKERQNTALEIHQIKTRLESQCAAIAQLQSGQHECREGIAQACDQVSALSQTLAPVVESMQDAAEAGRLARKYGPKIRRFLTIVAVPVAIVAGIAAWVREHIDPW